MTITLNGKKVEVIANLPFSQELAQFILQRADNKTGNQLNIADLVNFAMSEIKNRTLAARGWMLAAMSNGLSA